MLGFFKRRKNKEKQPASEAASQEQAQEGRDATQERDNAPTVKIEGQKEQPQGTLLTAMASHIGTREYQQDALYVSEGGESAFGILCDGMGGMADGAQASADVVEFMANSIAALEGEEELPARLEEAIAMANERLVERALGSGTTLVTVIVRGNRLYWASVGDSRIYILRGDEMAQVTRDHNYALELQMRVDTGELSQQEADENPQKDALISYIGSPARLLIDVGKRPFELQLGDTVLLCSDGLTKTLDDERIRELIAANQPLEEAARILPLTAFDEARGGQDNTSVILMRYALQEI